MKKRILSLLLAVIMICSLLPVTALAAGSNVQVTVSPHTVKFTANDNTTIISAENTGGTKVTLNLKDVTNNQVDLTATVVGIPCRASNIGKVTLENGEKTFTLTLTPAQGGVPGAEWTVKLVDTEYSAGGEEPGEGGGEEPGEGEKELTFPGEKLAIDATGIDVIDAPAGGKTITHMSVYLPVSPYTPYSVNNAWQDGTTIHVVLAKETGAAASLQAGFIMTGSGVVGTSGNKCTLENGTGVMNITLNEAGTNVGSYTVKFYVQGIYTAEGESEPTLEFTKNLSTTEVKYAKDAQAEPLSVVAAQSKGAEVSYQWYVNTENSTELADENAGGTTLTPGTELTVGEDNYGYTTIDINDRTLGSGSVTGLTIYLQTTPNKVYVDSATQDDTNIYIVLREDTSKSAAIRLGLSGTGLAYPQSNTGNTLTLSDGMGSTEYTFTSSGNSITYTINVTVEGAGGGEEPAGARAIAGATSASYTPSTAEYGTLYYFVVASADDVESITSAVAKITVVEPTLSFKTDLSSSEVKYTKDAEAAALTVAAEQSEGKAVTYQWYKNENNSTEGGVAIEGATAASYTPSTAEYGTVYYYVIASAENVDSITSAIAKIMVLEPSISFKTDLSSTEVKYVKDAQATALMVAAEQSEGKAVTYQWYSNTENSTEGGTLIEGATEASYTPAATEAGTVYYYAVAISLDKNGENNLTKASKIAKITVLEMDVEITTDLSTTVIEKYTGEEVTLTVAAKPNVPEAMEGWESKLTYQWYSNAENSTEGGTLIEGATEASYKPATDKVGTTYYYVVVTLDGTYTATSSVATVKLNLAPTVVYEHSKHAASGTYWGGDTGSAYITTLTVSGVKVDSFAWDGDTGTIMLSPDTPEDAAVTFSFTIGGTWTSQYKAATINGNDVKNAKRGTVTLENGEAVAAIRVEGWKNVGRTKTINISLTPTNPPTRLVETDSLTAYPGFESTVDVAEYFSDADAYYLVDGESKTPIDGHVYSFTPVSAGTYTYVFAASNKLGGMCEGYVTVTATASEVENGIWIRHVTSKGCLESVAFTDAEGNPIEGLSAKLEGNEILVSVPRSFPANGKIKATFGLTQNADGFPYVTTSNTGTGSGAWSSRFTSKTTTLSSGAAEYAFYLYNYKPSAVDNSYSTYKLKYVIQNEVPVLAEGQAATAEASMTADKSYELDLNGMFVDPDDGDSITGWKVSVNGAAPVAAETEEGVYSFKTDDAGEYVLKFYALDNYNALSTECYTVSLTVGNAESTYDVTVYVPAGLNPDFYWSADAEEGQTLNAVKRGNVYTVKVPTNVSVLAWRADGVGMSTAVEEGCAAMSLIKPVFTVKAGERTDTDAVVTVTHKTDKVVGENNNYLLLATGGYTINAKPSASFEADWLAVKLENYTVSEPEIEIALENKAVVFTIPHFAEIIVSEASSTQGKTPKQLEVDSTTPTDFASGTKTVSYKLTNGKVYEYRVYVPESNVNCDQYVTYVATVTKTDVLTALSVTAQQLEAGDKGRTTIDRNTSSNRGRNVADLYLNVNEKGYKTMNVGEEFKLIATRNYFAVCADWLLNKSIYIVEPDFHYSVVDLDGQPSEGVIEIDANGKIKAVGNGTAIVMVTYDAITLNHDPKLSEGAVSGYASTPNDFYGAIWPENTGVFVVSVGAEASGITTGMTINEDKSTSRKLADKAIDAEFDVIYYIANNGAKGEYTFTPGAEGVSVSVANPSIGSSMRFTGFVNVEAKQDGSVSVPLTEGRNIVKLTKDGKSEYQVITARGVNVTVNGEPLETAIVAPGQTVKIEFDEIYNPANRMALYNTSSAIVYTEVSGWDGKYAGNSRSDMGEYVTASVAAKRTVEHFVLANTASGGYANSKVSTDSELIVPEDYTGEYFTLSNGAFNIGGFTRYKFGDHRSRLGKDPEGSGSSDNILLYLGRLPDISIPVGTVTGISATAPDKTNYNVGDVFDPSGMEVTVNFETASGEADSKTVAGYTYDTTPFAEAGEHSVTISYGGMSTTVTVTVSDVTLDALEVTAQPGKTVYYIGDAFIPAGMVITAVYSDGSSRVIEDYTYAPDTVTKDTTAIRVTYGSKSVDVPIVVSLVERVEISRQPDKTAYIEGERFDPTGMIVKAYYTDGTAVETAEYGYLPSGQLTTADTLITVNYTGSEASANLQSATVAITVAAKSSGEDGEGGEDDDEASDTEHESIVVYVSFVDCGTIVVGKTPVVVYDEDDDGVYTIGDAFRALHRDFYAYGESGYTEVSNAYVTGWVTKFWGGGYGTFSYARNNGWASSTLDAIVAGDYIAAFNGLDDVAFSDLYTWFAQDYYSATTNKAVQITVKAVNIMGSGPAGDANCVPAGATVTVYDNMGRVVSELGTTVGADGTFSITFKDPGTYTLEVGGIASYGSYIDSPVVPSRCTVIVSGSASADKGDEDSATTLTPEVTVDENGAANVEVSAGAVSEAIEQAVKDGANILEIAPVITGDASEVSVSLPTQALEDVKDEGMGLKLSTPIADVKLPAKATAELAKLSGDLSVGVSEQKNGEVKIEVSVGGKNAEELSGGIIVDLPAENLKPTSVLVIVNADGTQRVVKKSVTSSEGVLAQLSGGATVKIVENSKSFSDTKDHWGTSYIEFATSRNLFEGIGGGLFDPNGSMTRAMLATTLFRLEDAVAKGSNKFGDVPADTWYTDAVIWANANKIVEGTGSGFEPDSNVTREQMATMLYRYAGMLGLNTGARGNVSEYTDASEISSWAKDAMEWAVSVGLLQGKGDNILDPGGNATRAEVATIYQRMIALIVK